MAEELQLPETSSREEIYESLLPQIKFFVEDEIDLVANLANVAAALKEGLGFFWVGFYIVKEDELVLGPYQGPIACTRIKKGRGVCGTAWERKSTIIVPNVDEFPGHIACSSESRSEMVVPLIKEEEVVLVMDVDSDRLDDFDEKDKEWLEKVVNLIPILKK